MPSFPSFPQPRARIGLLGVAFDANSSYIRGAALAPQKIRQAFFCDSANLSTEDGLDLGEEGLFADAGDIAPEPAEMPSAVERAAAPLYAAGLKVFAFGGDHSVTYPLARAAARHYPRLTLLHFDAHPDTYDNFDNNPYSHASPFARIMEAGLVKRLVQVGIRTATRHQREQAARFGIEVFDMNHWRDALNLQFDSPVYISFDLDCLDPAFAPGIAHREPGGLSTREALQIIQALRAEVVAADLVEFNPAQDPSGMTDMVTAKIFKEIVARMLA